jgi:phytanoyl-CoA hydroxylase
MMNDSIKRMYNQHGYAIAPQVIDPKALINAITMIEKIQAEADTLPPLLKQKLVLERSLPEAKRNGVSTEQVGDAIFIIGDLPSFDAAFLDLIAAPNMIDLVKQVLGTEDIRYHFSNVTMKQAHVGSSISWHRDYPNRYICPKHASFVRAMICLDGMTEATGATEFLLGSHLISDEAATAARASDETSCWTREIAVCGAGSVVLIHPKVIHGGGANRSTRHRRNIVIQWGVASDPIGKETTSAETLAGCSVEDLLHYRASRY